MFQVMPRPSRDKMPSGRVGVSSVDVTPGIKLHFLTVVRKSPVSVLDFWMCRCECGAIINTAGCNLRRGYPRSCGCKASVNKGTHGHTRNGRWSSEYHSWSCMRDRCSNPNAPNYAGYGGRGITVCDRWQKSFEDFLADMGPKPTAAHTIDRKDVNGNYEPGNCQWSTPKEQGNNRRNSVFVELNGRSLTVAQWAVETGLSDSCIRRRVEAGMSAAEALTTPAVDSQFKPSHTFDPTAAIDAPPPNPNRGRESKYAPLADGTVWRLTYGVHYEKYESLRTSAHAYATSRAMVVGIKKLDQLHAAIHFARALPVRRP